MSSLTDKILDAIKHEEEISDTGDLARALEGALEWHQPMAIGDPDAPDHVCGSCRYFTSEWPCPTVEAIAGALRVRSGKLEP